MEDVAISIVQRVNENLDSHYRNGKPSAKELDDEIRTLNEQSQRMQKLVEQVDLLPDSPSKELIRECIAEILTFYGNGLERIMTVLINESNVTATKILNNLLEDSFINGLLIIHDLHPFDLNTRLNLALEKVRPYIESHGGQLELLSLQNGIAKIKLSGSCKSCASSSVTLELAIKESIEENCPDLLQLDVEGVSPSLSGIHNAKTERSPASPWKQVNGLADLSNGDMKFIELNGVQLAICKIGDQLFAYRNCCPACDLPLTSGKIDGESVSCKLGHRYDIRRAGVCVDDPDIHLDPFPLLEDNGVVKISVG